LPANFCSSMFPLIPAPAGGGAVLRLSRTHPACPRIAKSHGLFAHSVRLSYAAERRRRPPGPACVPAVGTGVRGPARSHRSLRTFCGGGGRRGGRRGRCCKEVVEGIGATPVFHRQSAFCTAHRQRCFSLHRALPANTTPFGWHRKRLRRAVAPFSGIRDPHRAQEKDPGLFSERGVRPAFTKRGLVRSRTTPICDGRLGSRTDAGQPQNGATARRGRDRSKH